MWEAISRNRLRSWFLISLMGGLLIVLGFLIGALVDPRLGGPVGALVALVIWFVLFLVAQLQGDRVLLLTARGHQITREDYPQLWNVVEEMSIASGLGKVPKIFVIDDDSPNAFAVGSRPEKSAVAATTGLLKRLNRDELQGVMAHEIAHVKNLDIRFMTLASVMLGTIVLISHIVMRGLWYGSVSGGRRSRGGGGQAQLLIFLLVFLAAILAPIFAQLLYFACSRKREYLADASGALFTRYPAGLASALEKISGRVPARKQVNRVLAPLYIVNPLQAFSAAGLFSTHPPTGRRIEILRSMAGGAGYLDYEEAYRKVLGKGSSCLGKKTLDASGRLKAREPSVASNRQEAVGRARSVGDLLGRLGMFIPLTCICGLGIKVPPGLKSRKITCPRCGRENEVPRAKADGEKPSEPSAKPAPAALRYERKGKGWETFQCSCTHPVQLSPAFNMPTVRCPRCKREIEVV